MNEVTRSAEIIATEINAIKQQAMAVFLQSSTEIGKRLIEVKELVPHGEWGNWLKDNVDYSQSTANNLMQIYREYGSNSQALGNLNYTKAIALLAVPTEEREEFVKENDVEQLSTRELQKLIKEKQALEKKLEKAETNAVKQQEKLQQQIEKLKLEQAQVPKDDTKRMAELAESLKKYQQRALDLEKQLQQKPIDVPIIERVEVVPEDVQRELEELRAKATVTNDENAIKFRVKFDDLVKHFDEMLRLVGTMGAADQKKYKSAVVKLMDKMKASM